MILAKSDGYGRWSCFLCSAEGKGTSRADVDQQVSQHAKHAHGRLFLHVTEVDDGCEPDDPKYWSNPNERKWLMLATYTANDFTAEEMLLHLEWDSASTSSTTWTSTRQQRNPEGKISRLIKRMKHEADAKAKKAMRRRACD